MDKIKRVWGAIECIPSIVDNAIIGVQTNRITLPRPDLLNGQSGASKLGYGGAIPRVLAADTHYPRRAGLSSAACTSTRAARPAWNCSASDTMTDYAADCLSHERHDSVICVIVAILLTVSEFRTIETIETLCPFSSKRKKKFWKIVS